MEQHGHFGVIDFIVLFVYFGAMASLGPIFASKAKTTEGYFLGDRSFPGWLVGFSMFATSISSITFLAYPGDAYKTAWFRMIGNYSLPFVVLLASFYFLPFFRKTKITSAYEYLEGRFGPVSRVYAASFFTIGQMVRISLILYLVSVLVHEITGLDPFVSILIGGVVTSFYTVLGGIRAVLWTDFIQALVLWLGGIIALGWIIWALPGGLGQIFEVASQHQKFSMMDLNAEGELAPVPWGIDFGEKTVLLFFLVGMGNWLYEYSANQNVIQRFAAAKSAREARIAMWTCCVFSVPTWALFFFLGTALFVFYQVFPTPDATAMLTGEQKAEQILPYFVITVLPKGITGLVIAAVLSAAMSSLSSSINSVSAVALVDIYKRHLVKDRTDTHYVIVAKLIGLFLAVFMIVGAALLFKFQNTTLLDAATVLSALTAGGLFGMYLLGFFTKVGDDRAIIVGAVFTVVFSLWMSLSGLKVGDTVGRMDWYPDVLISPIHGYYAGIIGHAIMFILGFLIGNLLPQRKRDLTNLTVYTQDSTPLQ